MSRLFLFAIGGTGARVLRSLVFLSAGGLQNQQGTEIIPIIIDPDVANGDKLRTIDLLKKYSKIRMDYPAGSTGYFSTRFTSLNELRDGEGNQKNITYTMDIPGTDKTTFEEFLDISKLLAADDRPLFDYLQTLYSKENLGISLRNGFLGNPNIGVMVLNNIQNTQEFETFASLVRPGDQIFIISSLFGGTGAAGFPLLLNVMRKYQNDKTGANALRNIRIGAVSLMPYFELNNNGNSAISSQSFISKTKAAMAFYDQHISGMCNSLYYVGDTVAKSYENSQGGQAQKNQAHLVEFIAASAINHFINNPDSSGVMEYALEDLNDDDAVSLINFNTADRLLLGKSLIKSYIMHKFLNNSEYKHGYMVWKIRNKFPVSLFSEGLKDVTDFYSDFEKWLNELSENVRSFKPINTNSDIGNFNDLAYKIPVTKKKSVFSKKQLGMDDFHVAMNKIQVDSSIPPKWQFVDLFSKACDQVIDNNGILR